MDTPQSRPIPTLKFAASPNKLRARVSSIGAFAAVLGLLLGGGTAVLNAQILPPSTAYEWSGGAGSSAWADESNWVGGAVPPSEADVLFGNVPSGAVGEAKEVVNALTNRKLRALWFESGFDYTLSGESLWLGDTLADGGRLITVLNRADRHSEIRFNNTVNVSTLNPERVFVIYNESLGGLRFNGGFNTGGHTIRIEGGGRREVCGCDFGGHGGRRR